MHAVYIYTLYTTLYITYTLSFTTLHTTGMIGVRSALLTATKGTVVLDTQFDSYRPYVGVIAQREKGSLLAFEQGVANPYGIAGAQERGRMFINSKDEVFKDMIIGVHQRPGDLHVSNCIVYIYIYIYIYIVYNVNILYVLSKYAYMVYVYIYIPYPIVNTL